MRLHPLHLVFVHFPSALFVMDTIFSGVALVGQYEKLYVVAYYCLMAGVIGGGVSILSGAYDLFKYISKNQDDIMKPAIIHASIQTAVVLGFTFVLSAEYKNPVFIDNPTAWLWIIKIILIVAMGIGNYYGGELLLKYISKKF